MTLFKTPALLAKTALLLSACAVAPAMTEQETQIKADLAVDRSMPATRQMRNAIETQPLFSQAAFWSNEYNLNPGDLESAIKLASAVRKLGNANRAVEITQTTRALYPRDPYLVAEYAAALIAAERSFEALQPLDEALARTPAYGRLWSLKGAALDQQERYAEARQHYNRALQITPNDPNVLANIGFSFALSGDPATAETWLRRAVAQPSASAGVRQNLALVLQLQGKIEEAESLMAQTRAPQSLPTVEPRPTQAAPIARQTPMTAPRQAFSAAPETVRPSPAPQGEATPEQQQAMLDRIARSLQPQARRQAPQQGSPVPPQGYAPQQTRQPYPQAPQGYAQPPALAGGPAQAPARREAIRRRR